MKIKLKLYLAIVIGSSFEKKKNYFKFEFNFARHVFRK